MAMVYTWKKCVCKKTHTSGEDVFEENGVFKYKQNGPFWHPRTGRYEAGSFTIYRDTIDGSYGFGESTVLERGYTYLEGDFNKHFADLAEIRDKRLEEILND
jgi:hypothetical protein